MTLPLVLRVPGLAEPIRAELEVPDEAFRTPLAYEEREAARLCGVSDDTLARARAAGEVRASRIGRRVVYTREELAAWLSMHQEGRLRPVAGGRS